MNIKTCLTIGGETINVEQNIKNSKNSHVIIGTPGRIYDMMKRYVLKTSKLTTFVMDEADEMLSKGFKEQVYEIFQFIPPGSQIGIFSATMPPEVIELTDKFMAQPERILVNKDKLTLEGILQFYINVKVNDWKFDTLIDIYDTINVSQCIIYINSKNKLMEINERMKHKGFPVECIHGELSSDLRKHILDDFKSGKL